MAELELLLYQLTRVFLWPVMTLILIALGYALWGLGGFLMECVQRKTTTYYSPLLRYAEIESDCRSDDLELWILKRLERLRMVTRIAPMLGLVATMIAIGPALLALGEGEISAVSSNMVAAFSAVILSLLAASITFGLLTVRRRWLLEELRAFERKQERPL